MSGLGTGIAAMVNGFVGGRDIRNRWEDRADQKEWDKELREFRRKAEGRLEDRHGWAGEQQGWARDRHGVFMDQSEQASRQFEQAWSDDQAMRGALSGAVDAAEAGMVPAQPVADGPIATAAASTKSPQIESMGATRPDGVTPTASPAAGVATPQGPKRAEAAAAEPAGLGATRPESDLFIDMGDGKVTTTRGPRTPEEKAAIAQAATEGRLVLDVDTAARQRQIDEAGMARATANPVARALQDDPNHRWGEKAGAGRDLVEAGKMVGRTALAAPEMMANQGLRGVRQINAAVNPIADWVAGTNFGAPENVDINGDGKKRTLTGSTGGMPTAPHPKGASRTEAETAEGAAQVMDQLGEDPAMQAAAEGVPMGAKPGRAMTVRQRDEAATTFMESYRKNGVPMVQKELMRQGKFEAAQGLADFVNDQAAQEGMQNWSRAVFAAMNGDLEAAAKGMIAAYNSSGYFDDGMEIVEDQSELLRDDSGDVVGVRLAMRNQQTGEITVQTDSISDVINKGLWLTSPEKAAENYVARQQEMQKHLLELEAKRQEAGIDLIKNAPKEIRDMAQFLMEQDTERRKNSFGRDDTPPMTIEEAMQRAQEVLMGGDQAATASGETPVLRRAQ